MILAVGWNLLAGYTGQFSLAHHTFAGIGAYTSALLVLYARVPILVGHRGRARWWRPRRLRPRHALCLRMRAIYLALATWAFAESVRLLVTVEYQITRGDLGLAAPFCSARRARRRTTTCSSASPSWPLLVAWQIVHSRIGSYLRAIRDDEEAAAVMGVDTFKWKRFVFAISAVFAAVAGGLPGPLRRPALAHADEVQRDGDDHHHGHRRRPAHLRGPDPRRRLHRASLRALRAWGEIRMVLFALLVILVARAYPTGLAGLARTIATGLATRLPRVAPLFTPRRLGD